MSVIYNWIGVLELLCVSAGIVGVGSRASKDCELTFATAVFAEKKGFSTMDRLRGVSGNLFIIPSLHTIYGSMFVMRGVRDGGKREGERR